jgi:hypothetical protein
MDMQWVLCEVETAFVDTIYTIFEPQGLKRVVAMTPNETSQN